MTRQTYTSDKRKKSRTLNRQLLVNGGKKKLKDSLSNKQKNLSKSGLNKTFKQMNLNSKNKKLGGPKPSGIMDVDFGKILNTTTDVISTGARMLAGDPSSLLSVPNTVLKVVDTVKSTVNALNKDNAPKVVVQKSDVDAMQNRKVLDTLKKHVPVINTTTIPTSFANDVDLPPLVKTERTINGNKVTNLSGCSMIPVGIQFDTVSSTTVYKAYSALIGPYDQSFFGQRIVTIAANFQKWRLNTCVANFVHMVNTQVSGQVYMTMMNGTHPTNAGVSISDLSQREHFKPTVVYQDAQLAFRGPEGFLWCSRFYEPTEQIKFYCNQQFEVYTYGNNQTVYAQPIGYILLTFDIDFMHAAETPYSLFSRGERVLQGHWLSKYIGIDYSNHMRLLQTILKRFDKEIRSTNDVTFYDEESKLDIVCQVPKHWEEIEDMIAVSKYLEYPRTEFKMNVLKKAILEFANKVLYNSKVIDECKEHLSQQNVYIETLLTYVKVPYFKWLVEFATDHLLELALMDLEVDSDSFDTISDIFLMLMHYLSRYIQLCIEKLTKDDFDIEEEIDSLLY